MRFRLSKLVYGALLFATLMLVSSCVTTPDGPIYLVKVERGDTLGLIASNYDTNWKSIASLNGLSHSAVIYPGQILRVSPGPDGVVATGKKSSRKSKGLLFSKRSKKKYSRSAKPKGFLFSSSDTLRWPLRGKITSFYGRRGWRNHHGLDIKGARGTRIRAAAAGRVVFSGWQRGYGKVIKIKHGESTTLYAHCSRLYVKKGAWVDGGRTIAAVGSTGKSTGPHLHFEVQRRGKAVDPLPLLKRGQLLSRNP